MNLVGIGQGDWPYVGREQELDLLVDCLEQLAPTDQAFVVATVRSGQAAPDAIVALWKDGLAQRIELQPLSPGHVDELLETVLDGPIERRTGLGGGVCRDDRHHRNGGMLAHASSRAREYGLPAGQIEGAMQKIPDGAILL